MAEKEESERESAKREPQYAGVKAVCDIDKVPHETLEPFARRSKRLSRIVDEGGTDTVREHQRIIEVDQVVQHPQHRSKYGCAREENCCRDSPRPGNDKNNDARRGCQCPTFVSSPSTGKCEQRGESEVAPSFVLCPANEIVNKTRGAEDRQCFVFRRGEEINKARIQGE